MWVVENCGYLQGSLHLLNTTDVPWFCRVHLYFSLNPSKPYTNPAVLTEMEFTLCTSGKALPSYIFTHSCKITNDAEITKIFFEQFFFGQMTKVTNDLQSEILCIVCEPSTNVWSTAFLNQGRFNNFHSMFWIRASAFFALTVFEYTARERETAAPQKLQNQSHLL